MQRFRHAFFMGVYRLVRYHAWWVLFVSLLLSSLALYYIMDLPIKESLLDLLPRNDPLIEQFKLRNEELQQSDSMAILLQLSAPPATPAAGKEVLTEVAERIKQRLQFYPQIVSVDYLLDPKIATFQAMLSDPKQLDAYRTPIEQLQAEANEISALFGHQLEIFYLDPQNLLNILTFAPMSFPVADSLEGTSWRLVSYGDPATPQAVPPEAQITLNFNTRPTVQNGISLREGWITGNAICTPYSATIVEPVSQFFLRENIDIHLNPVNVGEKACKTPDALAALEQLYLNALGKVQFYFGGTLAEKTETISDKIIHFIQGSAAVSALSAGRLVNILNIYNEQLIAALGQFPTKLAQAQQNVDVLLALMEDLAQRFQTPEPDLSADGRSLRIVVRPSQPSYISLNFNKEVLGLVHQALETLLPRDGGIKFYIAGAYSFTAESNQALRLDMFYTTLISVAGIALIFLLTFRGIIYPLLVIIPLSMGAVWTAAWAKYALGGFNLVTALLPALLLGLGINYGIHFIGRFVEERQRGKSVSTALCEAMLHKGDAMLSGAITTALVFFVMMLSKSRGLYEMGLVAGFGVMASAVLTLLVLPSLIVVTHLVMRRRLGRSVGYRWGLSWAIWGILRARWVVMVLVGLLTLGAIGPASGVGIQFVSEDLMAKGLPTQAAREAIRQAGFSETEGAGDFFLFFMSSEEKTDLLEQTLAHNNLVLDVSSIRNYFEQTAILNDLNLEELFAQSVAFIDELSSNLAENDVLEAKLLDMEDSLRFWRNQADLFNQSALINLLDNLIDQLGEIQDRLQALSLDNLGNNLSQLKRLLAQVKGIADTTLLIPKTIDDFLHALPQDLQNQFITQDNEYIVYVQVSKDIYLEGNYEAFIKSVEPIVGTAGENYIGLPMIQHNLELAMEEDFWVSTLGAFGLILLALLIDFLPYRMLRAPLLVMLPLGLGYVWMLGGMGLLKLSFNLTNMVISPLLIGIGVDNGIHLMHRYLERPNDPLRVQHATESVAMPVIIANLATIAAFGSLLFASTPGLPVLGKSAVLGVGSVAFCSLTLLPAVLARRR